MKKIKLTKGELKSQRDALGQFRHYLPTLQLKKQQLQMKILEARRALNEKESALNSKMSEINVWSCLLSEEGVDVSSWIAPEEVLTEDVNIAGANTRIFKGVTFNSAEYDLYDTPFWIDSAIDHLRQMKSLSVEVEIIKEQLSVLSKELRVTTQRVNLFEKVKIPECIEAIRRIRIYLGDQQANAVGISKVAKKKIDEKAHESDLESDSRLVLA